MAHSPKPSFKTSNKKTIFRRKSIKTVKIYFQKHEFLDPNDIKSLHIMNDRVTKLKEDSEDNKENKHNQFINKNIQNIENNLNHENDFKTKQNTEKPNEKSTDNFKKDKKDSFSKQELTGSVLITCSKNQTFSSFLRKACLALNISISFASKIKMSTITGKQINSMLDVFSSSSDLFLLTQKLLKTTDNIISSHKNKTKNTKESLILESPKKIAVAESKKKNYPDKPIKKSELKVTPNKNFFDQSLCEKNGKNNDSKIEISSRNSFNEEIVNISYKNMQYLKNSKHNSKQALNKDDKYTDIQKNSARSKNCTIKSSHNNKKDNESGKTIDRKVNNIDESAHIENNIRMVEQLGRKVSNGPHENNSFRQEASMKSKNFKNGDVKINNNSFEYQKSHNKRCDDNLKMSQSERKKSLVKTRSEEKLERLEKKKFNKMKNDLDRGSLLIKKHYNVKTLSFDSKYTKQQNIFESQDKNEKYNEEQKKITKTFKKFDSSISDMENQRMYVVVFSI